MKKIIFILIAIILNAFCFAQSNVSAGKDNGQHVQYLPDSILFPGKFIPRAEAEKILRHPVYVKDSLRKFSGGLLRFQFTYKAKLQDGISGNISSLFFGFEQEQQTASAKRSYDFIKAENAKTGTIADLSGIGDEGFLTKDQLNNPFIIIRKDNKIFKLRLLYRTDDTSLDALKALAKKIVSLH